MLRGNLKEALALLIIDRGGPIGRYRLKDFLGLPEGIVRGMLGKLAKQGYVAVSKAGCSLTEAGKAALKKFLSNCRVRQIREGDFGRLNVGKANVALSIERRLRRPPMELRDEAVRAGARGAVIAIFEGGSVVIPNIMNLRETMPAVNDRLIRELSLGEGHVVVIAGADDRWRALEGALAIALALG